MRLIYVTFSLDLNFGSGSSSARIKWCSLLSAVLLLMKSIMPSLKPPKLCNLLLIMVVLYYLVFFRQLLFYICFGILFQLLHGDDELLITDMPKEEVESYHLSRRPPFLILLWWRQQWKAKTVSISLPPFMYHCCNCF